MYFGTVWELSPSNKLITRLYAGQSGQSSLKNWIFRNAKAYSRAGELTVFGRLGVVVGVDF